MTDTYEDPAVAEEPKPEDPTQETPASITLIIENEGGVAQIIRFPKVIQIEFDMVYAELLSMTNEELQAYTGPTIEQVITKFVPLKDDLGNYFFSDIIPADGEATTVETFNGTEVYRSE